MAAAVAIRLKPQTLVNFQYLRHFSSSSSPSPTSNSESNSHDNEESNPSSSYLGDIRSRLRQSPSTQRRIPLNPPKPDIFSSARETASLDEIRSKLAEFRNRSAPPSPSRTPTPISFQDLYKSTVQGKDEERGAGKLDFDGIRQTLKQIRENQVVPGHGGGAGATTGFSRGAPSLSLKNIKERLSKIQVESSSRSSPLPKSIFGKELEEEEGGEAPKERRTEFWTDYSYDELGEKLRMLRPGEEESKAKGDVSSLLNEINERLVKLRVLEEKAADSKTKGALFKPLKDCLVKLKESESQKKTPAQRHSILAQFTGFGSPDYMFSPPKEHLVEMYSHPDLMSSREKIKLELQKVQDEFKMSESDCGSARVQVAQLTTKIKHLSLVLHKKDKHSLKGLQAMVQRRKKLLTYLRRTDWESYCFVLSKLGLRDIAEPKVLR